MASATLDNVLFITADQFRGDCLGCAGHPVVKTPNLDRLASEGTHFQRHYTPAIPCAPARACIHTGLYLSSHRVVDNGVPLSASITNWAMELRKLRGLEPAAIGYTDQAPDPRCLAPDDPKLRRWDGGHLPGIDNLSERSPMGSVEWLQAEGIAEQINAETMSKIRELGSASWNGFSGELTWAEIPKNYGCPTDAPALESGYPAPAAYEAVSSDTYVLTSEAIRFIEREKKSGKPWALHLSLLKPHPPHLAPQPYNEKFHPSDVDLPSARAKSAAVESAVHPYTATLHVGGVVRPMVSHDTGTVSDLDDSELRLLRSAYYGLIAEVDDNIGRLLSAIDQLGESHRTLIIFTSDHGDLLGEHWLRGKVGYHDGAYHVPLIIKDPRESANATRGTGITAFTEHVDLMPTILDYAADYHHIHTDGRSLRQFIENVTPEPKWRSSAHWEFDFRYRYSGKVLRSEYDMDENDCTLTVLRTETLKLVHFGGNLRPLLFDLKADPNELCNVADDAKYAQDLHRLLLEMLSWRSRHLDQSLAHARVGGAGVTAHSYLPFYPKRLLMNVGSEDVGVKKHRRGRTHNSVL